MSIFGDIGGFFKGHDDGVINHGFKVAGNGTAGFFQGHDDKPIDHAFKVGADKVGGAVATAQNKMEDLYYPDIPHLKTQVKQLHTRYEAQKTSLNSDVSYFHSKNTAYKSLTAYNTALIILVSVLNMNDKQYELYIKQVIADTPDPGKSPSWPGGIASTVQSVSTSVGLLYVLRSIKIIGKLAKSSFFKQPLNADNDDLSSVETDVSTDAAEDGIADSVGDLAGEAAIDIGSDVGVDVAATLGTEAVADSALASTGIGIVVAGAVTFATAAIEGAVEQTKLAKAVKTLNGVLDKVDSYLANVEGATNTLKISIVSEENSLKALASKLEKIQPSSITADYPVQVSSVASFTSAAQSLFDHYGYYANLRENWHNAKARGFSWSQFESAQLSILNPIKMTETEAQGFLDLLKTRLNTPT